MGGAEAQGLSAELPVALPRATLGMITPPFSMKPDELAAVPESQASLRMHADVPQ